MSEGTKINGKCWKTQQAGQDWYDIDTKLGLAFVLSIIGLVVLFYNWNL